MHVLFFSLKRCKLLSIRNVVIIDIANMAFTNIVFSYAIFCDGSLQDFFHSGNYDC